MELISECRTRINSNNASKSSFIVSYSKKVLFYWSQDAETIFLLDSSGGAVVVKRAFRHLREDLGHRVWPIFRLHLGVGENIQSVSPKLVAQEEVSEIDLPYDIGKVKDLADEEPERVKAVSASVKVEVADNVIDVLLLDVRWHDGLLVIVNIQQHF